MRVIMVTVHVLSFASLVTVASAMCPDDSWTTVNGSSYCITPPARHADCDAMCGDDATLVCFQSRGEIFAVADAMLLPDPALHVWTGLYQWPVNAGAMQGWDRCTNGETVHDIYEWIPWA